MAHIGLEWSDDMTLGRFSMRRGQPGAAPAAAAAKLTPIAAAHKVAATSTQQAAEAEQFTAQQRLLDIKLRIHRRLIDELNLAAVEKVPERELRAQVHGLVAQHVVSERLALNARELDDFVGDILHEMTGLGPIEPLLADDSITDILINTHKQIYIERRGHCSSRRRASRTRRIC
jgi:pilus assembly protein CpaF